MFKSKAIALQDPEVTKFINNYEFLPYKLLMPKTFIDTHREWLINRTFHINGLDLFTNAYVTAGCTEAFYEVYNEDVYVLKGEYTYHRDTGITHTCDLRSIPTNSRLIISYPFADTGLPHENWYQIIEYCEARNIKIFIDACLAGCSLGNLDLRHKCITHIAFSFSKAFGTGHMRTGVVYARNNITSLASITNKHLYVNHMFLLLHHALMKNFKSDYIFQKYRMVQLDICSEHKLTQSDCVLFGLDNQGRKCVTHALEIQQPYHRQYAQQ